MDLEKPHTLRCSRRDGMQNVFSSHGTSPTTLGKVSGSSISGSTITDGPAGGL
eukprot:CAMPEP_0119336588 /NCGR_PEP_ID=MMETSP1333-20130426/92150_1 /TAXON_ID=418940 /ORGANISM="Scyphosphaera apsteinii, Strain RCC1455" /LENGTH=52 /DNA_ID=CAMNT_0007347419 /DNA_START=177 /DNA_END=335 /DNA_ORIENTATION=-